MIKNTKKLTYISLFSSAGIGCFGFKKAGFECIATNELIERRLNIQKINNKCKFDSGYISGDLTLQDTKVLLFKEIELWRSQGNDEVDVVIATPPCQGMSVANHKKAADEIKRNSLVVESIEIVKEIKPKMFIFENVSAFMKTGCTSPDGTIKEIGTVIYGELGGDYTITHRILNFKNYGSNSSRTRTVVIGVKKNLSEFIAPIELYPNYRQEKTLREVIGFLPSLQWGEFDPNDFFHQFRTYPEHMRCWIHNVKEGQGSFDNTDLSFRPHKVVDGKIILNQQKNGDKYTRQFWDKVAPCIHTRNDQMASQNTVHPSEDRVFSIRELMNMMTIPKEFKWIDSPLDELNALMPSQKAKILRKEEINIRQCIGEAVPTNVFFEIANNIKNVLLQTHLNSQQIKNTIDKYHLNVFENLKSFISNNPLCLGYATLARIAELSNSQRESNSAYFTNKYLINEICAQLPDTEEDVIRILEPSVGVGNFLPLVMRKYEDKQSVTIDVVDIDDSVLELVAILLSKISIPKNVHLNYINADFLTTHFEEEYFLVIGNPPFTKLDRKSAQKYLANNQNKSTTNLFEFFLEKAISISRYTAMITPKYLINAPEFEVTRKLLEQYRVLSILDFGEQGFKGVLVETICIIIDKYNRPQQTLVISTTLGIQLSQKQNYIFDKVLPHWVIYRNDFFDTIAKKLEFDLFSSFRDRQITNGNTQSTQQPGLIRVLKSRNIGDDGKSLIYIDGYEAYISEELAKHLSVYKYFNNTDVYLTPNMTYKPRVIRNIENTLVNGSVAILIPKEKIDLTEEQMRYFSSEEYRKFYMIARNHQTRSLNIDNSSVYWFGVLKGE